MNRKHHLFACVAVVASACSMSRAPTRSSSPEVSGGDAGLPEAGEVAAGTDTASGSSTMATAGAQSGTAAAAGDPTDPQVTDVVTMDGVMDDESSQPTGSPFSERDLHAPLPTLRRLTPEQIRASVTAVLGVEVDELTLTPVLPMNGLRAVGAASAPLPDVDLERWETVAYELAGRFVAVRAADALGCAPQEAACARAAIERYGRALFRRSLSAAELSEYGQLYESLLPRNSDPQLALQGVLSALLQSPNFLYRVELGVPDGEASDGTPISRLTDLELASRLSFFLWNRGPDEALLTAAEQGELATDDGLRAQMERMLADPAARAGFDAFVADLLALYQLDGLAKVPEVYPQATPALLAAMATETLTLMRERLLTEQGDYRTLFTSTTTHVDSGLAALYGLDTPAEPFASVELSASGARAGLLTHASLLALSAHPSRSSPTLRGKYVRERLLCQTIPPPPPTVNTTLPEVSTAPTARDRLTVHRTDPACAGCHSLTDPLGLGLENFDGIGAYRAQENGVDIDPSGVLDGVAFVSARELGAVVGEHPALSRCFVTTMLRYARGTVEDRTESAWIRLLSEQFVESGYRLQPLMRAMVLSAAFRKVGTL